MKYKEKNYYTFLVLFFLINFFIQKSLAIESVNFLSLKNNEVNVRVGPLCVITEVSQIGWGVRFNDHQ